MGRLEGRVAVNTGAGRGIGRATAVRFAASAEADFISGVVLPVSGGQLGA